MPLVLAIIALDAIFLTHAAATGRLGGWGLVIAAVPMAGALAYVVIELIPEWFDDEPVRQACRDIAHPGRGNV
jgi:hypothetical protein